MAIELIQTSSACPEQYDVMQDGGRVGHLHLRHGYFEACVDGPSGEAVYTARTIGDGVFDPSERDEHISKALAAIIARRGISYSVRY